MSNNAQSVPYDGYPAAGARSIRYDWAGDHFGPGPTQGNYQQGGYNLNATALGLNRIEEIRFAFRSQTQNYYAVAMYPANASNIAEGRAIPAPSVTVLWYAANGTEVANNTNLNGEVIRMFAQGLG